MTTVPEPDAPDLVDSVRGALHGLTALVLFTVALYAARRVEIPRRSGRAADKDLEAAV